MTRILKFRRICFVLIAAFSVSRSLAVGIAALKEQPFHADAIASILVYQKKTDDGLAPFVVFQTEKNVVTIDRPRIAALVDVPTSIPANITEAAEISAIRKSLKDLTTFSTRFPKSSPTLANPIASLTVHISKFDNGQRRVNGKWLAPEEYAAWKEAEKKEKQSQLEAESADRLRLQEQAREFQRFEQEAIQAKRQEEERQQAKAAEKEKKSAEAQERFVQEIRGTAKKTVTDWYWLAVVDGAETPEDFKKLIGRPPDTQYGDGSLLWDHACWNPLTEKMEELRIDSVDYRITNYENINYISKDYVFRCGGKKLEMRNSERYLKEMKETFSK